MRRKIVLTQSVVSSLAMVKQLSASFQPLGLIHGAAGLGKSSAVEAILSEYPENAVCVRACQQWRTARGMMLNDVLGAVNPSWGAAWHSSQFLYRTLLDDLRRRSNTILLIDEADYLVRGLNFDLLHTLRDLADQTPTRVLFISISRLALLLRTPTEFLEAISSRIGGIVEFRRASLADAMLLARELLEEVELEREVVVHCLRASNGSLRLLMGLFAHIERRAVAAKIRDVTLAHCADLGIGAPLPAAPAKIAAPGEDAAPRRLRTA